MHRREEFRENNVNREIYEGKTLALVGESGCGKSTLIRLLEPTSSEGEFEGKGVVGMKEAEFSQYRRQTQIIFLSHDLNLVKFIADWGCVKLLEIICEIGDTEELVRRAAWQSLG